MSETLHTCPDCGTKNLTERGLAAHRQSKHCKSKALTMTGPGKPALLKEFDAARKHVENIREFGRRASHESILLGHELNRLKLELKITRGGDRKSNPQSAGLIGWEDLLEQQTGLSADTCNRCMQLATAAKKHIPVLTSSDVLKQPFNALPEARQAEVVKALEKAADGRSMTQLMFDFGAWKDKGKNTPPKPTKASAANRKANAENETLTAAQLMETAKEQRNALHDMHLGAAWKALDTADLADLENKLAAYATDVATELKTRRKAK